MFCRLLVRVGLVVGVPGRGRVVIVVVGLTRIAGMTVAYFARARFTRGFVMVSQLTGDPDRSEKTRRQSERRDLRQR